MAKKQAIANETAAGAAPAPARTANPRTPRVKAAQHSKTAVADSAVTDSPAAAIPAALVAEPEIVPENREEAIAKIAYGYWEARGCEGGSAAGDWERAEQEYEQRTPALV